jgi:serine O-acetyltransferase
MIRRDLLEELSANAGAVMRPFRPLSCTRTLPSRDAVHRIVDGLRQVFFPGYFGPPDVTGENLVEHLDRALGTVATELSEQIGRGLCFVCCETEPAAGCKEEAASITELFLSGLPDLQRSLALDVTAAYEGDPATVSPAEAIFSSPGLFALTEVRIAHALLCLGVPILPRMMTEHAHSLTGIDIHPGARIGESFFIDHGTGVVIGETSVIGDRVRIYQGVTLGAKSFPLDEHGKPIKGMPRHPIVEDDVVIYSGATILGRVTIGRGAVIGGNVWLTRSVSPGTVVTQQSPAREAFANGEGI